MMVFTLNQLKSNVSISSSSNVSYWCLQTNQTNFLMKKREGMLLKNCSNARGVKTKWFEGHINRPVLCVLKPAIRQSIADVLEIEIWKISENHIIDTNWRIRCRFFLVLLEENQKVTGGKLFRTFHFLEYPVIINRIFLFFGASAC